MKPLSIPVLSTDDVLLRNHLVGRCLDLSLPIREEHYRLRFSIRSKCPSIRWAIKVNIGSASVWVGLAKLGSLPPLRKLLGESRLIDLPRDVQVAVIKSLVEPILDRLEDLSGEECSIGEVVAAKAIEEMDQHLDFSLEQDDWAVTRGRIAFSHDLLPTLLAWASRVAPIASNDISELPVVAAAEVGRSRLATARLRKLQRFDVILFDPPPLGSGEKLRLAFPPWLICHANSTDSWLTIETTVRWQAEHDSALRGNQQTASPVSADDIEVDLTFEQGEVRIPFGELQGLQAGTILNFERYPSSHVCIRASGQAIGYAELVRLGDRLGARVMQWRSPYEAMLPNN